MISVNYALFLSSHVWKLGKGYIPSRSFYMYCNQVHDICCWHLSPSYICGPSIVPSVKGSSVLLSTQKIFGDSSLHTTVRHDDMSKLILTATATGTCDRQNISLIAPLFCLLLLRFQEDQNFPMSGRFSGAGPSQCLPLCRGLQFERHRPH